MRGPAGVAAPAVSYHRATMSGAAASLPADDVRALMRLVGELRELGDEPPRWRRRLLASLETLCGTRAGLTGEIAVVGDSGGRAGLDVVHYIKQLHRAFGVRSRSELLARTARPRRLRTQLVCGGARVPGERTDAAR